MVKLHKISLFIFFIMDKKEYLLKILKKLFWLWSIAEELYAIIYYWDNITEEIIDDIILRINSSIKIVKDKNKVEIYKLAMIKIKDIKEKEIKENDLKDLDLLLTNL